MPAVAVRPSRPSLRLVALAGFVVAIVVLFAWMLGQTGASIPILSQSTSYHFTVDLPDAENLAPASDVQIAGVKVGEVKAIKLRPHTAQVAAAIDSGAGPLHQGVVVQVSQRTLLGEPILTISDGHGPALSNGATLSTSAVKAPVTIESVLRSLNPATLDALGSTVRTAAVGTDGRQQDITSLMSSMGDLGVRGGTVLDALAHQSQDLQDLAGELTTVLAALDTGQGQIQQVVSEADRLTGATAGQQQAVAATMQLLPGVLGSAKSASGSLTQLGASLGPVASGLQKAAPGLNQALLQLPQTTNQLQTLLPVLNTTLGEAPATLTRVPSTGNDAAALIPPTQDALQNINPMLDYLRPYGHDIIQIVSNIGAGTSHLASDGETFIAVLPTVTPYSVKPDPLLQQPGMLTNPYPLPGGLAHLAPFTGSYPHVLPEPK